MNKKVYYLDPEYLEISEVFIVDIQTQTKDNFQINTMPENIFIDKKELNEELKRRIKDNTERLKRLQKDL